LPVKSDVDLDGKIAVATRNFFQIGVQPVANSQNLKNLASMFTVEIALFLGRLTLWDIGICDFRGIFDHGRICDHKNKFLELLCPSRNYVLDRISFLRFTIMKYPIL
jgi:hypothetical protein